LAGVFGHRLSEFRNKPRLMWLVRASFDGRPAIRVAQETSGSWGVLFFAFFLMDKHKKEWSPKRRKRITHRTNFALCKQKTTHLKAKEDCSALLRQCNKSSNPANRNGGEQHQSAHIKQVEHQLKIALVIVCQQLHRLSQVPHNHEQ